MLLACRFQLLNYLQQLKPFVCFVAKAGLYGPCARYHAAVCTYNSEEQIVKTPLSIQAVFERNVNVISILSNKIFKFACIL